VLKSLLDSPEIGHLIEELQATRWTGRPGYPLRTMLGLALAKSLYAIPTWTKTVALVADHWKLQRVLGCEGKPPSLWSAYRFAVKLRENGEAIERCIDGVIEGLRSKLPSYGTDLAIDASDMPAYANGSATSTRAGRNATGTPTRMQVGDTARRSRLAKAAASTATASMPPSALPPTCRLLGRSRQGRRTKRRSSLR